jgi:hypothetical protein
MGHRQASLTFVLRPVPPFRLNLTVWALRRRPRNRIDRWDGTTYRRVIVMGGRPTELAVRQAASFAAPRLIVMATPPLQTLLERRHVRCTLIGCSDFGSISPIGTAWPRRMRGCGRSPTHSEG